MKQVIGSLVAATVFLIVAADELPKLIPFVIVVTVAGIIGRVVWLLGERWR
jgi:hypothetical protein